MILSAQTCIFTLGGGDIFTFDGAFYEVLSPARNEPFPFDAILTEAVENLNICLSSPFHTGRETEFLETKDAFVRLYMQCQTAFGAVRPRHARQTAHPCLILSATS